MRNHLISTLAAILAVTTTVTPSAAAPDAAAIQARIVPLDGHLDIDADFDSDAVPATVDGSTQFDLPKVRRGGLKAGALAIFVPQEAETDTQLTTARAAADAKYRIITGLATRYPDRVALAHSPAELRKIVASGKFAVIESIVNGGAFISSLEDIDAWAAKGIAIFGFVHAGHNRLADSSRPAQARGETAAGRNGGLSPLGKQAVERLNHLGLLIDISQLSDAAFDDVLTLTKAPVIASHSDLRAQQPQS
jgi:membrane dipeptidase